MNDQKRDAEEIDRSSSMGTSARNQEAKQRRIAPSQSKSKHIKKHKHRKSEKVRKRKAQYPQSEDESSTSGQSSSSEQDTGAESEDFESAGSDSEPEISHRWRQRGHGTRNRVHTKGHTQKRQPTSSRKQREPVSSASDSGIVPLSSNHRAKKQVARHRSHSRKKTHKSNNRKENNDQPSIDTLPAQLRALAESLDKLKLAENVQQYETVPACSDQNGDKTRAKESCKSKPANKLEYKRVDQRMQPSFAKN